MKGNDRGKSVLEYRYSWLSRHRGTRMLLLAFVVATLIGLVRVFIEEIPLSDTRPEIVLYMLIGALILGFVYDFSIGVPKLFDDIIVSEDGLEIHPKNGPLKRIPWVAVEFLDEFDVREKRISEKEGKKSDYVEGLATGGIRVITNDNQVTRIYRSIKKYKELRNLLIEKCPHSNRMINGVAM